MESTSIIALSRQGALRREMAAIANNIANMDTTGYKAERVLFVDHLRRSRSADSIGDQRHAYVRDYASFRDVSEGNMRQTGNPLDLAIQEDGFLVVDTESGERYTRGGNLRLDSGGQLVTNHGDPVLTDAGAPVFFAPEDTQINIAGDGTISTENGVLGKLRLVRFANLQNMERTAGGYYTTDQPPQNVENPKIAQGMLEGSNIEPILEMTRMIDVSRQYQSTQKMIEREDERMRTMIRDLASMQTN